MLTKIILIILSLILIGFLANLSGKLAEKLKLPSLIGMILIGMIIGPSFLNLVPKATLNIAPTLKDIALVTVLFIGGLGISLKQMKQIGRPAILLSVVPATLEGLTIAVLVPSMVDLINRKIGQDKAIPQMILVGASADDTVAITLFTTFISIYFAGINGESVSIIDELISIPFTIIISIFIGWILSLATKALLKNINSQNIRVLSTFSLCLLIRFVENHFNLEGFNSLLTIMIYGFFLRTYLGDAAKNIQDKINVVWKYGKLYLFAFVGMAINPTLVGKYIWIGVIMLMISLSIRSIGVLISLIGTNLNVKERIFCVVAYLPKATVQSAKAGIPLQMGIAGGEIMQALAILSVLITAPIGAIGIKLTSPRFLSQGYSGELSA